MLCPDLILRIRSRLRDNDFKDLHFSDNEILDALEEAQNELVFLFDSNIKCLKLEVKGGVALLPKNVLSILSVSYSGNQIPIKTYSQVILKPTQELCLYQKSPLIYAFNHPICGEASLYANIEVRQSPKGEMFLPNVFNNALIFKTLSSLLQTETNANNLERVGVYANLYKEELNNLRSKIGRQRERKQYQTPFIKV